MRPICRVVRACPLSTVGANPALLALTAAIHGVAGATILTLACKRAIRPILAVRALLLALEREREEKF